MISFVSARLLGMLSIGLGLGIGITLAWVKFTTPAPITAAPTQAVPKVLYWYDPMEPGQHFDKPGKSPFMDMELVPKYADTGSGKNVLNVDPAQVQNLGMRTAKVRRQKLLWQQEFPAVLRVNERNQAVIQLRAGGFVAKAWPLAPGDAVTAGQPIATLFVPEWLDAQNELLASKAINSPRLVDTWRARLHLLGMPEALIAQAEQRRAPETQVTVTAPISGVIEVLDIKTGMALAAGQTLARISNFDSLWLDVAIPEAQASVVHAGDNAVFYAANVDATSVSGTIDALLPSIDALTRTLTARVLIPNPDGKLKPGTSGHVVLSPANAGMGLVVPTEAVIRTGKRAWVMVADAAHRFRPVAVRLGAEMGDHTVILSGLEDGEDVVASGQFLLDSEASLLGFAPDAIKELQP